MSTVANFKVVPRPASPASDGYLRQLIEKQPVCLVRVDLDGVLLAVNDAALSMLGANDLAEVLHASLVERFLSGRHDWWREFAGRVWREGSGSTECELLDLAGATRSALLKGIAHWDHPDGIDSLFLTIRDTSAQVRLERAVHEALEARQRSLQQLEVALGEQERLSEALEQARSEGERLTAVLSQAEADRQHRVDKCEECRGELLRTREEQHRAELAANAHKAQELLDHLQEQLATALCEQKRLAAGHQEASAAARARQDA
ncbi:MAG: PAS domain-containing protein, partial [Vicinamibacterales bacterium]